MPDTALPGEIIGYRKNGQPIRLAAGGEPEEGENAGPEPKPEGRYFSQDELTEAIEKARQQEKDKLYPQISKTDERTKAMNDELKELRAFQKKQEATEATRLAEIEAERKKREDAELSAQERIERRQAEFDARMAQFQQEQDLKIAMLEKENELTRLQAYIQRRVNEEQDSIAPELIDLVDGKTPEDVEASIESMKARTARIVESMQAAGVRQRAAMPGVSPSAGTNGVGPMDATADRQYSADDVKSMGMKEYAALRDKMGFAGANNQGLFRQ